MNPKGPVAHRRRLLGAFSALIVLPPELLAQATSKRWRIGYLTPTGPAQIGALQTPLIEALRALGYVEGRNVDIVARSADDDPARLSALAREIVDARVDLIVAVAPVGIMAAGRATRSIPIVMSFWGGQGLIESGLVASLNRPGGNVTGISILSDELDDKRLQKLLELVPSATRVAVLVSPGYVAVTSGLRRVANAAHVELIPALVDSKQGYATTFADLRRQRVEAVLVPSDPRFYRERQHIVEAAATERLPAMYEWPAIVGEGGLAGYGPDHAALQKRIADYVDRILKGAKPGDLPIEQATAPEFALNRRTARALGLTLPAGLIQSAVSVVD